MPIFKYSKSALYLLICKKAYIETILYGNDRNNLVHIYRQDTRLWNRCSYSDKFSFSASNPCSIIVHWSKCGMTWMTDIYPRVPSFVSYAVGSVHVTTAVVCNGSAVTGMFAGQLMVGGVVSKTTTNQIIPQSQIPPRNWRHNRWCHHLPGGGGGGGEYLLLRLQKNLFTLTVSGFKKNIWHWYWNYFYSYILSKAIYYIAIK